MASPPVSTTMLLLCATPTITVMKNYIDHLTLADAPAEMHCLNMQWAAQEAQLAEAEQREAELNGGGVSLDQGGRTRRIVWIQTTA